MVSDRIGVTDVTVTSESVDNALVRHWTTSTSMVTEPKVFPHQLQQLPDGQVVCTYRDQAWRGLAPPYFKIWTHYQGKKPTDQQLYGKPYPADGQHVS